MIGASIDRKKEISNLGPKVKQAHEERLENAMGKGFAFSQEVVPSDRGQLRQSGFSPQWDGDTLVWGYSTRYAKPIEFGTDPFYPPLQPLLEWSERVTGDKGLGFYVARHKIPNEGLDSQPYVRPGIEVAKRYLKSHDLNEFIEL